MSKKLKVEIEWKLLQRIAEYYEFPSAVFLGNMQIFPKCKTRNESFRKKAQLYDKIAVLSFPDGKRILTKINRLPKKKQIAFFRAFNQHGVGVVTAYKKVTGKPHKFIYDKKCKTT